jgi:hypothetical protein
VKLSNLRERLLRAGIAARHVRRYLGELQDHYDDALRQELQNGAPPDVAARRALERLGPEDALAECMLAQPSLRSTAARFPRLVFGVLPLAGWLGVFIASLIAIRAAAPLVRALEQTGWGVQAVYLACLAYARLVPVLIGAIMIAGAVRQRLSLRWPMIGLAALSMFSGSVTVTWIKAVAGSPGDQLGIGSALLPLVWPSDLMGRVDPSALGQTAVHAAITFSIGLVPYACWRARIRGLAR